MREPILPTTGNEEYSTAEVLFYQGTHCMEIGAITSAEMCFRQALNIFPDFAEVLVNLALLLDRQHINDEAEIYYRRSLELNPDDAQTHLNFGVFLAKLKRFSESETAYKQAIILRADAPENWSNLGVLYACMKQEVEAEECYRTALSLSESYSNARFNLSYLLLRQGRFAEGWFCLEARHWVAPFSSQFSVPRWQGGPLSGYSILICHEGGYGDMLQFCRYAQNLKDRGAQTITLFCPPPLKQLLSSLTSVDKVISHDEKISCVEWDYWIPLLSIPYFCTTRLNSIPATIPYLTAPENLIKKWRELLPRQKFRVGLAWQGNPQFENDAERSMPSIAPLAPLWQVAGVDFISLQKTDASKPKIEHPEGLPITDLGSLLEDFADTAAVVASLDLVICVDTALAHLTGALGIPCWVLLPAYKPDWRWLVDRANSPWYPNTMRLFHQTESGNWSHLIEEVTTALMLQKRKPSLALID